MAWEEVEVPRGQYVGWGNTPGQFVEGAVIVNNPTGATEPLKEGQVTAVPCPLLEIELTKPAASFDRALARTDYAAGERVCLSVSQKQLQRAVQMANMAPGDLVRIELKETEPTGHGTVKIFKILVDRGAAKAKVNGSNGFAQPEVSEARLSQGAPASFSGASDDPPF
jgi:hypothetical protein